jgi:hypothetical protein
MSEAAVMTDRAWWDGNAFDKHDKLIAVVRYIRRSQADRKVSDLLYQSMYGGSQVRGFGYGVAIRSPLANLTRLTLNVCRNMVAAVTSKIAAKNKPKPTFLTEGGNYDLREKAQDLESFVGGVFYESGVYQELTLCFRDCCVFGTGILKILAGSKSVEVERTHPSKCIVDNAEGADGKPANFYQRDYIDRLWLLDRIEDWLKGDSEQLEKARVALAVRRPIDQDDQEFAFDTTADQVLVTEGWHLGPGLKGGRHVIAIDGCTLLEEEWDGPFPFAFVRWTPALDGFFGEGLVEELMGIQREINKLLQQIQRGHHLITGHYLIEQGSRVVQQHINNDLAAMVKYAGTKPDYVAPSIIAPEVYTHLWQLYAKAYEITGISQMNATGMKPAGLDSGEAQRVYQDIQTERFLEVGQAYEEFVVETARQVVRCARRVGGSYKVFGEGKEGGRFLQWKDVDIPDDLVRIRVYPTSMLPTTPAGKLAWMQDMLKSGALPPEDVLEIVDFPDIDAYKRRKLAPRKIIERNIASILRKGEFVSPEPADNHALALTLVNEAYHEARLDGVPEEKLELLRRYMADTTDLMPKPPPPVPDPTMGMPPPIPGAPPPPMPPAPMPMAA